MGISSLQCAPCPVVAAGSSTPTHAFGRGPVPSRSDATCRMCPEKGFRRGRWLALSCPETLQFTQHPPPRGHFGLTLSCDLDYRALRVSGLHPICHRCLHRGLRFGPLHSLGGRWDGRVCPPALVEAQTELKKAKPLPSGHLLLRGMFGGLWRRMQP